MYVSWHPCRGTGKFARPREVAYTCKSKTCKNNDEVRCFLSEWIFSPITHSAWRGRSAGRARPTARTWGPWWGGRGGRKAAVSCLHASSFSGFNWGSWWWTPTDNTKPALRQHRDLSLPGHASFATCPYRSLPPSIPASCMLWGAVGGGGGGGQQLGSQAVRTRGSGQADRRKSRPWTAKIVCGGSQFGCFLSRTPTKKKKAASHPIANHRSSRSGMRVCASSHGIFTCGACPESL